MLKYKNVNVSVKFLFKLMSLSRNGNFKFFLSDFNFLELKIYLLYLNRLGNTCVSVFYFHEPVMVPLFNTVEDPDHINCSLADIGTLLVKKTQISKRRLAIPVDNIS